MRVERHIFGSFSGYTTLARSPGIGGEDCRVLESGAFSFGQSNDRHFLRSLAKAPAYFTRSLAGGRRALTRVLEGSPDDNNRLTLCLVTAVMSQADWDAVIWGDPGALLETADLWTWDGSTSLPALEVEPPLPARSISRKAVPRLLALISEIERNLAARRAVVITPDEYSLADLRALEMLIPPSARRAVTTAFRSLSTQLPVMVNCLDASAGQPGTFRYQPGAPSSPYAQFLEQTELASGTIPVEQVAEYRAFGAADKPASTGSYGSLAARVDATAADTGGQAARGAHGTAAGGPVTIIHRTPRWPIALLALLALVLAAGAFVLGRAKGMDRALREQQAVQEEQARQHSAELRRSLDEQRQDHEEKMAKTLDVPRAGYVTMLESAAAKLAAAKAAQAQFAANPPPSVPPNPLPGDAQLQEERQKLAAFCQQEHSRQRERFSRLKAEIDALLRGMDARKLAEESGTIAQFERELGAFSEQWPMIPEAERKWLADLRSARTVIGGLAVVSVSVGRLRDLLQNCEDDIRTAGPAPSPERMAGIRLNMEDALSTVESLPGKVDKTGIDLSPLKKNSKDRIGRIRKWLDDKEKATAAATRPATRPARDPRQGSGGGPLFR